MKRPGWRRRAAARRALPASPAELAAVALLTLFIARATGLPIAGAPGAPKALSPPMRKPRDLGAAEVVE